MIRPVTHTNRTGRTHQENHEARIKLQHKLAHLHRKVWRETHGYGWLLALLDNEWRYT